MMVFQESTYAQAALNTGLKFNQVMKQSLYVPEQH